MKTNTFALDYTYITIYFLMERKSTKCQNVVIKEIKSRWNDLSIIVWYIIETSWFKWLHLCRKLVDNDVITSFVNELPLQPVVSRIIWHPCVTWLMIYNCSWISTTRYYVSSWLPWWSHFWTKEICQFIIDGIWNIEYGIWIIK